MLCPAERLFKAQVQKARKAGALTPVFSKSGGVASAGADVGEFLLPGTRGCSPRRDAVGNRPTGFVGRAACASHL